MTMRFYTSLRNNLIWLFLYLLAIPAGLFIALFLNQSVFGNPALQVAVLLSLRHQPGRRRPRLLVVLRSDLRPCSTSSSACSVSAPVNVLGDERYVTYGIIAAGIWPQTAYCMILYLTGLNAVDPEQIEAARLDGAKGWRMLWYIVIPQLKPATFIAFVVTIIGALRSFDLISIMTNGGPFGESRVLSFYMFEVALSEYGFRMGYGAAIAVILFLIMMVFITYFLWSMLPRREGER